MANSPNTGGGAVGHQRFDEYRYRRQAHRKTPIVILQPGSTEILAHSRTGHDLAETPAQPDCAIDPAAVIASEICFSNYILHTSQCAILTM